jgi:plastocyanin
LSSLVLVGCPVIVGPTDPTITVTPSAVTLEKNKSQSFQAKLSNNSSSTFTWSVASGNGTLSTTSSTPTTSVRYTAPATPGNYTITVTSPDVTGSRVINVKVVDLVSVLISPSVATVAPGDTITLNASLDSGKDSTFNWESTASDALSSTTGKTVTFTAPSAPGIYQVFATSADASGDGTANITVAAPFQATPDIDADDPLIPDLSIRAGERQTFIIDADEDIFEGDQLVAIEADTSSRIKLSVFDSSRNLVAVSDDPAYFTSDGSTSSLIEPQALSRRLFCVGPCVFIENLDGSSERYYVQIESSVDAAYDLFAYAELLTDSTEPGDIDDCVVTEVPAGTAEPFALETLGDVDCILSDGAENRVTLETVADTALAVRADVYDGATLVDTLNVPAGGGTDTYPGTGTAKNLRVVVRSSDGRAGPSRNSEYKITFNTP